jgi:hypothetical protein
MPLFSHHNEAWEAVKDGVPGLAEVASAQGWLPADGKRPFDGQLEDAVHDMSRTLYGVAHLTGSSDTRISPTFYRDAFRGTLSGRNVTVANAWTGVTPGLFGITGGMCGVAVCVAELPSVLPIGLIQPRRLPVIAHIRETPTGDPAFDDLYSVGSFAGFGVSQEQVLTPELRQLIMAHDDWIFRFERYLLACITKGPFRTVDNVTQRISEVLAFVGAIPASVMPDHVDHSSDDLIARISKLTGIEDAMAMLQQLTPDDRERLARSGTPLAAFADVQTPQQAIARFQSLDPQRRMQLMTMFMRVEDSQRGH